MAGYCISYPAADSWIGSCVSTRRIRAPRAANLPMKMCIRDRHIDDEEHKKLTGQTNKNILDMAQYLSKNGKKMWIRHVLVPGITTDERYLKQLREFIDTLKTVDRVEVLPYHTLGVFKWKELGIPYQLEGVEPPTKEQIECAKRILNCQN